MAIENGGSARNYATLEAAGSHPVGLGNGEPALALDGAAARHDGRGAEDDYSQAGNLFRILTAQGKQNLFDNLAAPLSEVDDEILQRQLGHFDRADPAYGAGVRAALKARA